MFVFRFLKRFMFAALMQPVGLAVAIILLVTVGWKAALIAVAATLLVTALLVVRAVRKGITEGKDFMDNDDEMPSLLRNQMVRSTLDDPGLGYPRSRYSGQHGPSRYRDEV